jgi:Ca2+-binding RTX toxin-like protein
MGRGGDDTLNGGGGADKFLFDSALNVGTNVDVIADFAPGIDRIHLDEDIFTALAAGALPPGRFHSVPGATDANDATDRIIYDSANGNLYYDADGNGELSSSVLFATLTTHPAITAADFFIVN